MTAARPKALHLAPQASEWTQLSGPHPLRTTQASRSCLPLIWDAAVIVRAGPPPRIGGECYENSSNWPQRADWPDNSGRSRQGQQGWSGRRDREGAHEAQTLSGRGVVELPGGRRPLSSATDSTCESHNLRRYALRTRRLPRTVPGRFKRIVAHHPGHGGTPRGHVPPKGVLQRRPDDDSVCSARSVIRWVGARCGSQCADCYCSLSPRIGFYRDARFLSCATRWTT